MLTIDEAMEKKKRADDEALVKAKNRVDFMRRDPKELAAKEVCSIYHCRIFSNGFLDFLTLSKMPEGFCNHHVLIYKRKQFNQYFYELLLGFILLS